MLFARRPSARFNRGRISGKTGPAGVAPGPPPAVPVLTAPTTGASLTNGTPVTVSATSTDGDLTGMQWVLDPGTGGETVIQTDLVAPYSQSWTPSVSVGSHTMVARAVRGPQSTDSTPISVTVAAATPATPVLTSPPTGLNVFNGVAITVSATTTDSDLDRIDFILDPAGAATVVATDSTAPYSTTWTPTGVSDGNHTLIARAVRGAGTADSASVTITVGEVLHTLVSSVTTLRAWQSDFGLAAGSTLLASGTTPPAVTISGTPTSPLGNLAIRVEIQTTGALGVGTFRYGASNTGTTATFIESGVTLPAGGTYAAIGVLAGVTFTFPSGTYTNNNVYQATCSSWTDQKNSTTAVQATASKQLRILLAAGARLCLRADGVDDSMLESTIDLPAPNTTPTFIYFVFRTVAWTTNKVLVDCGAATEGVTILAGAATPAIVMYDGTSVNSSTGATVGSLVRGYAKFTGSTADALKLGAAAIATGASAGTTNPGVGIRIGAAFNDSASFGNYDYAALIYFNGAPSSGELSALDAACVSMYSGILT